MRLSLLAALSLPLACSSGTNDGTVTTLKEVRDGYVDIMEKTRANKFKALLPKVASAELQAVLNDADTMWYDRESLTPAYQDSVQPILGVRANHIGRELAVDGHLVFDTNSRFHFPYGHTGGTDKSENLYVVNFWHLPKQNGKTLPVVYWEDETTRWRWLFPSGTYFGEVLFVIAPDNTWHPFEIRTRKRYQDGWAVDILRPFTTAKSLEEAIKSKRPNWQQSASLSQVVKHLTNDQTLTSRSLETTYYPGTFERVDGYVDELPDMGDDALVKDLLKTTTYSSAEGAVWKQNGNKETYAAATQANFSIVPKGYEGGLLPVNEVSCKRCHEDTGRQIGEFSFNSLLYGEIWGEDQIFTWHLFDEAQNITGAFHQNRALNPDFAGAGLVVPYSVMQHPASIYKPLHRRFSIIYQ